MASVASSLKNDLPPLGPQLHFPRTELVCPLISPPTTSWHRLLPAAFSSDFILMLKFDRRVFFETLMPQFAEERQNLSFESPYRRAPKSRWRPCSVSIRDILDCTLWWLKSSGRRIRLCVIFGLILPTVSDWFNYELCVLYRTLRRPKQPAFWVQWPTLTEMIKSAELLEDDRLNCTLLRGFVDVVDGGRFPCADYVDADTENSVYENYACTVDVTNFFVYSFKGEIIHASANYPGVCHDKKLANLSGLVSPRLDDDMTPPAFVVFRNFAFLTRTINEKNRLITQKHRS